MPLHDTVHVDLGILHRCLDAYGRVAAEHTSDTTLAAAERLIRARLGVYECLTAAGLDAAYPCRAGAESRQAAASSAGRRVGRLMGRSTLAPGAFSRRTPRPCVAAGRRAP